MIDAAGVSHGFIRDASKKGVITVFDVTGAGTGAGQGTAGAAIDDGGDITGTYIDSGTVSHGFVRVGKKGKITTFDIKGAGKGFGQGTTAVDIDASGIIVGQTLDSGSVAHAFIRNNDKKGTATVFNVKGAGTATARAPSPTASTRVAKWRANTSIQAASITPSCAIRAARSPSSTRPAPVRARGREAWPMGSMMQGSSAAPSSIPPRSDTASSAPRTARSRCSMHRARETGNGQGTDAFAINTGGAIAGYIDDSASVLHGYIRTP